MPAKRIVFTITNDPVTDQRMIRIAGALHGAGYRVCLVGRRLRPLPVNHLPFKTVRLPAWWRKGPLQYVECNLRIFCWLLFHKADLVCAIDLDTILPVYCISRLRGIPRVYDAHEYFSQLPEVIRRPAIQRWWLAIERFSLPRFPNGYTVSQSIAEAFHRQYGVRYGVIRNLPRYSFQPATPPPAPLLLYQGAINEGRGLEQLIPAMKEIPAVLHLYGDGNFLEKAKELVRAHQLEEKVIFKGVLPPGDLQQVTRRYTAGINLVAREGLNQYYSLANKFFDYMQAGLPQLTMDFPEYRRVNEQYEVALLIPAPETEAIATALNHLLTDGVLYMRLAQNCRAASQQYCWEKEEHLLLSMYQSFFRS